MKGKRRRQIQRSSLASLSLIVLNPAARKKEELHKFIRAMLSSKVWILKVNCSRYMKKTRGNFCYSSKTLIASTKHIMPGLIAKFFLLTMLSSSLTIKDLSKVIIRLNKMVSRIHISGKERILCFSNIKFWIKFLMMQTFLRMVKLERTSAVLLVQSQMICSIGLKCSGNLMTTNYKK